MKNLSFLLTLLPFTAAAATLPQVERPDFSVSQEVVASLDAMIGDLQAAAADDASSWQVDRALGNCREVRRTVAHWPGIGAYDPQEIGRAQSELQSLMRISYAVFCLKKKKKEYTPQR